MRIPVLSFFSGGGFLDLGFEEAGFEVVWTNENNHAFADLYEHGITAWRHSRDETLPPAKISNRGDVRHLKPDNILKEAFCGNVPSLFGMVGGPPCTDFSVGGRGKGTNGEHGPLTRVFADLIQRVCPDFFVMENVPGLWTVRRHREFLISVIDELKESYLVDKAILNALEYGVPQDRDRLFITGFSRNKFARKISEFPNEECLRFPWPEPSYPGAKKLPWPKTAPFGSAVEIPEGIPLELTVNHVLTTPPSPGTLPNGKEAFVPHSPRFWSVAEGDDSRKSFKRLHRYRYSPTAWYGNNEVHLHPWEPRRLTVREALRLQTVPDEYELPNSVHLSSKFRIICNGVPCSLARSLASSVRAHLSKLSA